MCETGLLIHGEGIAVPYDRFRDRIMFPISDRNGRTIAFGGRALAKDAQAKYLNSPETPLFHKGAGLFSHHRARKASHDKGRVIVVEGYIDVVAMHAAGFPETVATLGTALTEDQAGLLWQMAPQPILCFDGDKAGRKAANRAAEMALPLVTAERTFGFALLPGGQDPDDLIRASDPPQWRRRWSPRSPLVDLVWSRETEGRRWRRRSSARRCATSCAPSPARSATAASGNIYWEAFERAAARPVRRTGRREHAESPRPTGQRRGSADPMERTGLLSQPIHASASLAASAAVPGRRRGAPPREAMILNILSTWPALAAEKTRGHRRPGFLQPGARPGLARPPARFRPRPRITTAIRRAATRCAIISSGRLRLDAGDAWPARRTPRPGIVRPEAPPTDVAELLQPGADPAFRDPRADARAWAASQAELASEQSEARSAACG